MTVCAFYSIFICGDNETQWKLGARFTGKQKLWHDSKTAAATKHNSPAPLPLGCAGRLIYRFRHAPPSPLLPVHNHTGVAHRPHSSQSCDGSLITSNPAAAVVYPSARPIRTGTLGEPYVSANHHHHPHGRHMAYTGIAPNYLACVYVKVWSTLYIMFVCKKYTTHRHYFMVSFFDTLTSRSCDAHRQAPFESPCRHVIQRCGGAWCCARWFSSLAPNMSLRPNAKWTETRRWRPINSHPCIVCTPLKPGTPRFSADEDTTYTTAVPGK